MNLAQRAGITVDDFINENFITTEYEQKFFDHLTTKQQEMYLVRKFVHRYKFVFGGTHKECLVALNKFCIKNNFKPRKTEKTVSNIALEPFMVKEFEDFYE